MQLERPLFLSRIPNWIYVSLIILIVLLGASVYIHYRLKPFLTKKIKQAVTDSTKGLYKIDFADIHVNILKGSLGFDSLSLVPDTSVVALLRKKDEAPKHLFLLELEALSFQDISFRNIYFDRKLNMSSVVIYKPHITIIYNDFKTREEDDEKKTAYQQISKFLRSVTISDIIFNEADIKYIDKSSEKSQTRTFKGLNIIVTDLKIDSASQFDKSRFYYAKNIKLNLKDHKFITKDGLYTISIEDISSSTSGRNLRLSKFRVRPNYPEMEFSRKFKTQHDRYDLSFNEILFTGINFLKLNTQRRLAASSLLINGSNASIFMNREMPPVTFDKGRNYPHVVLKRLKIRTTIDTLFIRDTRISYSEYNPKSKKKGTITFNRFNAQVRNISNDPGRLSVNHWARANVSTWFMNKGKMTVNVNFNLTAKNADFNFSGGLGKMDMGDLNSLSRNMSLVEIQSGTINKAEFEVSGNLRTTSGYLKLYYTGLKVNVLKKDDDTNELKKRGLISALANTIVIKNNNPDDDDGKLRIGKTSAERINSESFFNLMWKSVFAGLKESVGFTLDDPDKQKMEPPDKKTLRKMRREKRSEERKKNN